MATDISRITDEAYQNSIENMEKRLTDKVFETNDPNYYKRVEQYTLSRYLQFRKKIPRNIAKAKSDSKGNKGEREITKRMCFSQARMLPLLRKNFEDSYSVDFPYESEFVTWNVCADGLGTDWLERWNDLSCAAAIFMLDRLREYHVLDVAKKYLLSENLSGDLLSLDFKDSLYSNALIESMAILISNRYNKTNTPYKRAGRLYCTQAAAIKGVEDNPTMKLDVVKMMTGEIELHTPEEIAEMSFAQRYTVVRSLLPAQVYNSVRLNYANKYWECIDLFLYNISNTRKDMENSLKVVKQSFAAERLQKSVLNVRPASKDEIITSQMETMDAIMKFDTATDMRSIVRRALLAGKIKDVDYTQDFPDALVEQLSCFHVEDPYETAFAIFELLDEGSNYIWIESVLNMIGSATLDQLPWIYQGNDINLYEDDPEDLPDWDEEVDVCSPEVANENCVCVKTSTERSFDNEGDEIDCDDFEDDDSDEIIARMIEDLKRSRYQKLDCCVPGEPAKTLDQLIYDITGVIIPRRGDIVDLWGEELIGAGFSDNELSLLFPLIDLANNVGRFYTVGTDYFDSEEEVHTGNASDITGGEVQSASIIDSEALMAEIKQLKKQNKELREALHIAQKDLSNEQEEIASLRDKGSAEKEELEKLRDLLLNPEDETPEECETNIEFPYSTKHNIVVFGGHDSWLKVIKDMLPDVRFIDRTQFHFAEDIVYNADMIFIQSNSLPHSLYYKIMGLVRSHKIPFYYFNSASAEKCARFLAAKDSIAIFDT